MDRPEEIVDNPTEGSRSTSASTSRPMADGATG
jgi:hypothetical protein